MKLCREILELTARLSVVLPLSFAFVPELRAQQACVEMTSELEEAAKEISLALSASMLGEKCNVVANKDAFKQLVVEVGKKQPTLFALVQGKVRVCEGVGRGIPAWGGMLGFAGMKEHEQREKEIGVEALCKELLHSYGPNGTKINGLLVPKP